MIVERKMNITSIRYANLAKGSVFALSPAPTSELYIKTDGNGIAGKRAVRLCCGSEYSYTEDTVVYPVSGTFMESA